MGSTRTSWTARASSGSARGTQALARHHGHRTQRVGLDLGGAASVRVCGGVGEGPIGWRLRADGLAHATAESDTSRADAVAAGHDAG
ncbi:MAG: hypothetical protein R3F43_06120 [bacterium]